MIKEDYFITENINAVNFLIKEGNELVRISNITDDKGYRKFKFIKNFKVTKDFKIYKDNREKILSRRRNNISSKDIAICNSIIKLMWYLQHNYELIGTEQDRFNDKRIVFRIVKELS